VRKEPPTGFFKNYKIWYRSDRRILNIQLLDAAKKALRGLTLYEFDDQFRCTQRIDASEARWADGKWRFYDGAIRDFGESGSIRMTAFKEMDFPLKENWESFQKSAGDSAEMSYGELRTYIQKIQAADTMQPDIWLTSMLKYPIPFKFDHDPDRCPVRPQTGRSGGVA